MEAYRVYIDKVRFPVLSEKVQIKTEAGNKTYSLINGGEVNVIKSRRLDEITMKLLLPAQQYSWAWYEGNKFRKPAYYIDKLLKLYGKQFVLVIYRDAETTSKGKKIADPYNTRLTVTLEDMSIEDDPDEGRDVMVNLTFKTYRDYGTKQVGTKSKASTKSKTASGNPYASKTAHKTKAGYTSKKGDSLILIAHKMYGRQKATQGAVLLYRLNARAIRKKNPMCRDYTIKLPAGIKLIIPVLYSELYWRTRSGKQG